MPLFACSTCGTVDNTALCDYWVQQKEFFEQNGSLEAFEGECSTCWLGKWHGEFPARPLDKTNLIHSGDGPFLIEDPSDAIAADKFLELILSCSPSEQRRIVEGCKAGYFEPSVKHEEVETIGSNHPIVGINLDSKKKRKEA